ncbi:hypothetical protein FT663_05278 [Candidozyma haemuli var. vulneris]|nr:hypothetical protein FT662_05316 [[Candida] haemuloni var. vulneris]KAF3985483.1 hypothetical protein FT663_05278 [[Candida] haemuloni var. vulneris]
MAKKRRSLLASLNNESNCPPILDMRFDEPLFSSAAHPTRPILVSGLATGHLYCHTYDADMLEEKMRQKQAAFLKGSKSLPRISQLSQSWWSEIAHTDSSEAVSVNWKTKRHKGSCRSVLFDVQENSVGEYIYSAGTDNVIKKASTETGKVIGKREISTHYDDPKDAITTMAISTTHPFLLTGTDNGHALVFDTSDLGQSKLKFKLSQLHEDSVNKILPMPAVSPYHFLSLGSTTLTHFDIRKGPITQSDDQEDELLSMCYPTEFVDKGKNDTVLVSHGDGIVTLWRESTNRLSDQISRIKVNKAASIDAIIPTMNAGDDDMNDCVWCGDSEGLLHRVDYKKSRVVETRAHSASMGKLGASDEVGGLDIDFEYRLISSGMEGLKIWTDQGEANGCDDEEHNYSSDSEEGSSSDTSCDLDSSQSESNIGSDLDLSDEGSGNERAVNLVKKRRQPVQTHDTSQKKKKIDLNKITREDTAIRETEIDNQKQSKRKEKNSNKGAKSKTGNNGIMKFEGM